MVMTNADASHSLTEWLAVCEWIDTKRRRGELEDLMQVQLGQHEVVAVIGARQGNVGEALWTDPRCAFMSGEDAVKRGLPYNTRAVVFTRFLGHAPFKGIMAEVRKRKLVPFPVQGTGQLKRTLALLLATGPTMATDTNGARVLPEFTPEPETRETTAVVAPETRETAPETRETERETEPETRETERETPEDDVKLQRGDVIAWVRERYEPGMKFADLIRLADRARVPFKASSVSAAFYAIRREAGVSKARKGKPAPPVPVVAAPVVLPPVVAAPVVKPSESSEPSDELVRLVDEVMAGLSLVREAALKMAADREKMTQILLLAQQLGK
jgi:hypothetical protein